MGLVEVRRIAAVGILGFGVNGVQVAPASKDISSGGENQYTVAQEITHRTFDFSNWPGADDNEGCYSYYPDSLVREYQVFIRCPNYSLSTILPTTFQDFTLDITARNLNGSNVWYGPLIATNYETIRESVHRLFVSDDGVFRYQQVEYDAEYVRTPTTKYVNVFPGRSSEGDSTRFFRIIRDGKRVEVISDGVLMYENEILLTNQRVNIGFGAVTPRILRGEAQVALSEMNISFPRERTRLPSNLAMLPNFNLALQTGLRLQTGFAASKKFRNPQVSTYSTPRVEVEGGS